MGMRYVGSSEFRNLAHKKKPPRNVGVKFTSVAAPMVAADSRTFRFCFSDSGTDLSGDKLNAKGWDTTNFDKNPVVLFSHDPTQPIGKASNLQVQDGRLLGDITFAETPLADEICQLVAGGFVRAVSVGFMPIKYSFADDPDRAGGIDYESMSLLEVSVCSIPCNPRALIEAKSQGIPTGQLQSWMIERLDDKSLSPTDREVFKSLLNSKELDESDSASGGYAVGNCGRDRDEQCGMIDSQECTVHRDEDENDTEEKTLMAMNNVLKEARAEIRRLNNEIERSTLLTGKAGIKMSRHTKAEDDAGEGDDADNPEVHLSKGLAHAKAAEELHDSAVDHMAEAHKCFSKAVKAMGDDDGDEDDQSNNAEEKDDDGDEIEKIKARAVARMTR